MHFFKGVNCLLILIIHIFGTILAIRLSMKNVFFILMMMVGNYLFSQVEAVKVIKTNFKNGDAKELAKSFNNSLNVRVLNEDAVYSKSQAESVMANFMKQYPVSDFQVIHQGESKEGGLHYAVCKYISGSQSFRVYILLKQNIGSYLIDTLDFSGE
jgi:hypothetical protein